MNYRFVVISVHGESCAWLDWLSKVSVCRKNSRPQTQAVVNGPDGPNFAQVRIEYSYGKLNIHRELRSSG